MSLLANATPAQGAGAAGDAGANGGDDAAAAAAAAAAAGGNGQNAGAGGDGSSTNAADFTAESFAEALKNEDVYKDGKIFGKYTSIEEAAKGHKELMGQLVNRPKAPDEYDLGKVAVKDKPDLKINAEDPYTKAMLPVMKKHNISQEAFNDLAAVFLETQAGSFIDSKAEMATLGANAQALVDNVATHVLAKAPDNLKQKILNVTATADGIEVLNYMLKGKVETPIPVDASTQSKKSSKEWGAEAAEYDKKHKLTIGMDQSQQQHYEHLRKMEAEAKLEEEGKAKK